MSAFNHLENLMKPKSFFVVGGAVALILSAGAAWADAEAAMNKAGCMACHAKDKKLVGPSFKDIAAKYKGQDAAASLAEKVRAGGKGVFGPIPMPPNPASKIDDASLKEAVAFILKS
jgi:cytochrome c